MRTCTIPAFCGWLFVLALALAATNAAAADSDLPEVRPVDLAKLSPASFSDEDLDLPYYLVHFHTVANAVEASGEDRGFIHINVWRLSDKPSTAPSKRARNTLIFTATQSITPSPGTPGEGRGGGLGDGPFVAKPPP